MTPAKAIALIAVKQVSTMLACAVVLVAAAETVNWLYIWHDARRAQ